jgi:molecular chaperone DnaJ
MTDADFYQVLGVPASASQRSIRDAYLALVRRLHPDRVGPGGTARFQAITEAYDTLSDPVKRRRYDHRCAPVTVPPAPRSAGFRSRRAIRPEPLVTEPISLSGEPDTVQPSLESLFERIVRNFTAGGRPKAERLETVHLGVILTGSEAAAGVVVPIAVPVVRHCRYCGGLGGAVLPCPACAGRGSVLRDEMLQARIPPMVRDGAIVDVALDPVGITNLAVRLHVVVRNEPLSPMAW